MPLQPDPNQEAEFLQNFAEFVDASQHIASIRIKNMKDGVISKRNFAEEMTILYQRIKKAYRRELERLAKEKGVKDISQISFLEKNRRTAYVLLSSNAGLYGNIISKTFDLFQEQFDSRQGDAVIIGRFGRVLFERRYPGVEYTFFDFSEKRVEPENFRWVIEHLVRYEKVLVFYGEFKSLISQEAAVTSISGAEMGVEEKDEEQIGYLLEPTPESVMIFFETQISAALFEQVVFESQLAKFASRMLTMHYAHENIQERLEEENYNILRLRHQIENKKQIGRISGRKLWKR